MPVGHSRDLRQVRDADDLTAFGEDPQLLRYHLCSPPADTGVNLIKNQRWNLIGLRQHRLDCQHDTRQLTAGRHHTERPNRFARIRGNQEFRLVDTARREMIQPPKLHLKLHIKEIQFPKPVCDLLHQLPGKLLTRC